jgi:hypothetical protein
MKKNPHRRQSKFHSISNYFHTFQATNRFFVTTSRGLEDVLQEELEDISDTYNLRTKIWKGSAGCYFEAGWQGAIAANLTSMCASRVLLVLSESEVENADELYQSASQIDWTAIFAKNLSFSVSASVQDTFISNSMFVALKGERFDANTFAAEALEKGAKYVLIDNESYHVDDRTILVQDSLIALQELATFHRQYLKLPIIALTGSNGKTTTKELVNVVLAKKFQVKATVGNLNNHIGVPLTLLSFDATTQIGIVEMGANHQKEIVFRKNYFAEAKCLALECAREWLGYEGKFSPKLIVAKSSQHDKCWHVFDLQSSGFFLHHLDFHFHCVDVFENFFAGRIGHHRVNTHTTQSFTQFQC